MGPDSALDVYIEGETSFTLLTKVEKEEVLTELHAGLAKKQVPKKPAFFYSTREGATVKISSSSHGFLFQIAGKDKKAIGSIFLSDKGEISFQNVSLESVDMDQFIENVAVYRPVG